MILLLLIKILLPLAKPAIATCIILLFLDIRNSISDSYRGYGHDLLNPIFKFIDLPRITFEKLKLRIKEKSFLLKKISYHLIINLIEL